MEISYVIEVFISCIIMTFAHMYAWKSIFKQKINLKSLKNILLLILVIILMLFNYLFVINYIKIVTVTFVLIILCYFVFNISFREAILAPIVSQIFVAVSEFLFVILFLNILKVDGFIVFNKYIGTMSPNIVVFALVIIFSKSTLIFKVYRVLENIIIKLKKHFLIMIALLLILTINLIQVNIYYRVSMTLLIVVNVTLMIIYAFIIFKMTSTQNKYLTISDKYNNSKNSLLEYHSIINHYRMDNHENKSQIRLLRSKIDPKNKEALKYIDEVFNIRIKNNEELLNKTKIIPECNLRTLIDFKLITMEEKKIKNTVHIDKKIETTDFLDMDNTLMEDICKITGVFLDNAIEALEELDEKEIQLDLYRINNYMCISVVNNFKGNIDTSKLSEPGYTTKKSGHGYGLSLVKKIVESNKSLEQNTYIDNGVFKQLFKIKM